MAYRVDQQYQNAIMRSNQSKNKNHYDSRTNNLFELQEQQNVKQIKTENLRLKKLLKESQAKRNQITKQCSQYHKKYEQLEQKNFQLLRAIKQGNQNTQGDKYRVEQLKFLNKQLSTQIQQLRSQNEDLSQKLRYCNQILQKKYEELQDRTFRRIQQAMKRIKKGVHYLQSLSPKQIQKTKQQKIIQIRILVQNLRKASQILKGKIQEDYQNEIQELMNPIKNIQEELHQTKKELSNLQHQNIKLQEQVKKHKKIQRELLPQYKQAIQKLKKNLVQVRSQLSQNQYDKSQLKKKYQDKIKQLTNNYNELSISYRKSKIQKKMFQNKIEELEAQVQEQKQRLVGQNQMLKKLYNDKNQNYDLNAHLGIDESSNEVSALKNNYNDYSQDGNGSSYGNKSTKNLMKKNHSSKNIARHEERDPTLKTETLNFKKRLQNSRSRKIQKPDLSQNQDYSNNEGYLNEQVEGENMKYYGYEDEGSMMSQESLKNEICKIDQQIMMIQRNLTKQLKNYQ